MKLVCFNKSRREKKLLRIKVEMWKWILLSCGTEQTVFANMFEFDSGFQMVPYGRS